MSVENSSVAMSLVADAALMISDEVAEAEGCFGVFFDVEFEECVVAFLECDGCTHQVAAGADRVSFSGSASMRTWSLTSCASSMAWLRPWWWFWL